MSRKKDSADRQNRNHFSLLAQALWHARDDAPRHLQGRCVVKKEFWSPTLVALAKTVKTDLGLGLAQLALDCQVACCKKFATGLTRGWCGLAECCALNRWGVSM
jgi:hypothetical protein